MIIERAIEYVKEKFTTEFSGHDYFHTMRVFKTATRIAEREGANLMIVQLAALLHDVDDRKISPMTHAGQDNAREFLRLNDIPDPETEWICKIISEVSFSANAGKAPSSIEGKCVQDADRLDAIGAIGIARAFAYGGSHNRHIHHPDIEPCLNMSAEEYKRSESTTVNHFYEKLFSLKDMMNTETARALAEHRDAYMREFIDEFMDEWEGVK